jgi:hypothetical protein
MRWQALKKSIQIPFLSILFGAFHFSGYQTLAIYANSQTISDSQHETLHRTSASVITAWRVTHSLVPGGFRLKKTKTGMGFGAVKTPTPETVF